MLYLSNLKTEIFRPPKRRFSVHVFEVRYKIASNRIRTDDLHITSVAPYQLGHRSF